MGIFRRYEWRFKGYDFYYEIIWPEDLLSYLEEMDHSVKNTEDYSYYVFNEPFSEELVNFLNDLLELGSQYIEFEEKKEALEYLLSFVQHLNYYRERGEYPRYPMETVIDGGGDCEDTAILMAFICWQLGYDCAFLQFENEDSSGKGGWAHLDLDIAPQYSDEFSGSYWVGDDGTRYFYASCNGRGYRIGEYSGNFGKWAKVYKL